MKQFNKKIAISIASASLGLFLSSTLSTFALGPAPVDLLTASNYVILAKSGISTTGSTTIVGNLGVSPVAATGITGFGLVMDVSNQFSTSALVTGRIYASDYASNTPALMTTAISNMEAAYTDAAGRTIPTATELGSGNIGGMNLAPGLYKWSTNVTIPTDLTLTGGANDVWIFQVSGTLDIASAKKIILAGGAQASNIFWQVAGQTTLGTTSTFEGNILDQTAIVMNTGATLHGRALAQTAVTMDANTVSVPVTPTTGTLRVIKLVVNSTGTAVASDFSVHVKLAGTDVSGSPLPGTGGTGNAYTLAPGTYVISEDVHAGYSQSFTGDCNSVGSVDLLAGNDKTCTIVNTDIPAPVAPTPVYSGGTSGGGTSVAVVPLIGLTKVPSPLALPSGAGNVTYNYTVWNVSGQQALTVRLTDDSCSPLMLLSGDTNNNSKLDPTETWKYSCTALVSKTTTNTAIATGYSDDVYHQTTIATAVSTVVVGSTAVPPLLNIVKVPSVLTALPFGGSNVTYTYTVTNPGTVPVSDVKVIDDKCLTVSRMSGDLNGNNLLDAGEAWVYTCSSFVQYSTRNVATVTGKSGSLIAVDYAFANVLVSAPGLPNTGLSPESDSDLHKQVTSIKRNLQKGIKHKDVMVIQKFLISKNAGPAAQALEKAGTSENFGPLTRAALAEFQKSVGITPASGNFGSITRAYISSH